MTGEVIPLPVGLREVELTVEAAEQVRKILDDPTYPTHQGQEMPTADPSALLEGIR